MSAESEILQQLPPDVLAAIQAAQGATQAVTQYDSVYQQLFPTGVVTPDNTGRYEDPTTGGVITQKGVIIDPSAPDALNGVIYQPGAVVAGSWKWLQNARKKWSDEKVGDWRKTLYDLGYDVAPEGAFDEKLWRALDEYHRRMYFYGEVIPVDASSGGRLKAEDVADPVAIRQDVRTAFSELWGDEPDDEELEYWAKVQRRAINRALANGKSPEVAVNRGREVFAQQFLEDPVNANRAENLEENTKLRDSLESAARASNFLAFGS